MKIAFISARKDELSCKLLLQEFRKRQSFEVQIAHTDEQEWSREIRQYLDRADYVFLLVSPAYFSTTPEKFPQINQIVHRSKFSNVPQKVIALLICPCDWKGSIIEDCREILPKEGVTIADDKENPIISSCEIVAQAIFGDPPKRHLDELLAHLKKLAILMPKNLSHFNYASLFSNLQKFLQSVYLINRNHIAVGTTITLFVIIFFFIFNEPSENIIQSGSPSAQTTSGDSLDQKASGALPDGSVITVTNSSVSLIDTFKKQPQPPEAPIPFFVCLDGEVRRNSRMIVTKPTKSDVEKILSKYRKYSGNVKFKIDIDEAGDVTADIENINILPELPQESLDSIKSELTKEVIQKIVFIGYIERRLQRRSNTGSINFYFNQKPISCHFPIQFK